VVVMIAVPPCCRCLVVTADRVSRVSVPSVRRWCRLVIVRFATLREGVAKGETIGATVRRSAPAMRGSRLVGWPSAPSGVQREVPSCLDQRRSGGAAPSRPASWSTALDRWSEPPAGPSSWTTWSYAVRPRSAARVWSTSVVHAAVPVAALWSSCSVRLLGGAPAADEGPRGVVRMGMSVDVFPGLTSIVPSTVQQPLF
jgi:hypothetical protein